MKKMIWRKQTPARKKPLDPTVSVDLDAVGDAAEDAVGEPTAVARLPLLRKLHPNSLARIPPGDLPLKPSALLLISWMRRTRV